MRKLLIGLVVGLLFVGAASAQPGDVAMQAGEVRLVAVPAGGQMVVRVTASPPNTGWFMLSGERLPSVDLIDAAGATLASEVTEDEAGNQFIQAPIEDAGDYFLRLVLPPDASATYVRLAYSQTPPTPPEGDLFTGDVAQVVFEETFEDNARGWWVGFAQNVGVTLNAGALRQSLSGEARTFSGYSALPGTSARDYWVEAEVEIGGDTNDSVMGLLVRMIDDANFYAVQIAPERGAWRFIALEENIWIPITAWREDPRLLNVAGPHTLGVWVLGDVYLAVWDGQPLGHAQDARHSLGGVGLYAEVLPGGIGAPQIRWEALRVSLPDARFAWGRPVLGGRLSDEAAAAPGLAEQLLGVWFWADDADTQSVEFTFQADGTFQQVITNLTAPDDQRTVAGQWSIRDGEQLVLDAEGLPQQRYSPTLRDGGETLFIPELDQRRFIRLSDAP